MDTKQVISLLQSIDLCFYSNDHTTAMGIAIAELSKSVPRQPIVRPNGFGGRLVICPNCETPVYNSDWTLNTQKKYFDDHCHYCMQLFTPKGKYIGFWEPEVGEEECT